MYMDTIQTLLKSEHFLPKPMADKFEISSNEANSYVDINAITATIQNIEMFISEPPSRDLLCDCFMEVNYFGLISIVPAQLKVNVNPIYTRI